MIKKNQSNLICDCTKKQFWQIVHEKIVNIINNKMEKAYYITYLTDLSKDFSPFDGFYIGDAYCDKNFLKELEDDRIMDFLKSS